MTGHIYVPFLLSCTFKTFCEDFFISSSPAKHKKITKFVLLNLIEKSRIRETLNLLMCDIRTASILLYIYFYGTPYWENYVTFERYFFP